MQKMTFDLMDLMTGDGDVERLPDGGVIFIKGDVGDRAFLVKSGRVEIREGGRVLETMEPGELFGEMALIDADTRSASAVALSATELLVIDRDSFHRLVSERPGFAITVMRLMVRRLRAMNATGPDVVEMLPLVQEFGRTA